MFRREVALVPLIDPCLISADAPPPSVRPFSDRVPAVLAAAEWQDVSRRSVGDAIEIVVAIFGEPAVGHHEQLPAAFIEAQAHRAFDFCKLHGLVRVAIAIRVEQGADVARARDDDFAARVQRHAPDVVRELFVREFGDAESAREPHAELGDIHQFGVCAKVHAQKKGAMQEQNSDEGV